MNKIETVKQILDLWLDYSRTSTDGFTARLFQQNNLAQQIHALYTERAGEMKFNNPLEADALDWDTRNLEPVPPVEPDLMLTQLRRKLQQIEYCHQNCNRTVASCFQKRKRCKTIFNQEVKDQKSWVNVMTNQILEEVQPLLTANEAKIRELEKLVDDFTDPDDCNIDHHGYCQAHGWLQAGVCPHFRAKQLKSEGKWK